MSTNYSKVYLKFGTIEVTIEGDDTFVSEQFRNIFNLHNADAQEYLAKGAYETIPEQQQLSAPSLEKPEDQGKEAKTKQPLKEPVKETISAKSSVSQQILNSLGTNFADWLANLPNSSETRDKILIAAYYNQTMNAGKKFHMRGINAILNEHGVSVSKISNFLDTFEIQKIIAKVSDSSRKGYQFTKEGEKYIQKIFATQLNESN
jgi:hypothetical protein